MAPQHFIAKEQQGTGYEHTGKAARERQLQQEHIHQAVITRGLKAAGIWGFGGLAVHSLLTYSVPRYARHTMPFKVFCLLMIPTAAFFTATDVAAKELDREFAQQFSVTPKIIEQAPSYSMTSTAGLKQFFKDHQYEVIGYGWLGLIGSSLLYNFAQPRITLAQKFINARMVAQTGALLGLVGVAALNIKIDKTATKRDLHFENAMKLSIAEDHSKTAGIENGTHQ